MIYHLSKNNKTINGVLEIGGSKSESNRLLMLRKYLSDFKITNLSKSDDTKTLIDALINTNKIIDVHHAGTAMRFLLSYYASKPNSEVTLTGSARMKSRPIFILVNALRDLGANIEYKEKEGYPPIKITGKKIISNQVSLPGNVSSQYISSLMMLGVKLDNGIKLNVEGSITSKPYILMTKKLIEKIGYNVIINNNQIEVLVNNKSLDKIVEVESDWSSASYFYSIVAFSKDAKITLKTFKRNSIQGDSIISEIYQKLGVETRYEKDYIIISKNKTANLPKRLKLNLSDSPDLAQTIAVTCLGLGIECELSGLHTLKIKETDRIEALKKEFIKLGVDNIKTSDNTIYFKGAQQLNNNIKIGTHQDHRMALSFATLAVIIDISIESPNVVSKSFPNYWKNLKTLGFKIN
ncbi:MAG: 3-phosphoshikimate 1-carboxyvinyltransferase [Pelagibacterales bacterium]|nr:3-phosphoshikimate 1-carboxyvinyltransferase [Pelagibacterales bacterium]